MPSAQRGQVEKRGDRWSARWRDENGRARRRTFGTGRDGKADASAFLQTKIGEVLALRRGDFSAVTRNESVTVEEAVTRYLAAHEVDPATTDKLRQQLRHATSAFGDRELRTLRPDELAAWRRTLSEGSRSDLFRALRQVLEQAARWGWIEHNPARHIRNPKPKRAEFASWEEVETIVAELDPRFAAIPVFAAGTGLRPEEWIALERRDLDRTTGVVTVERVYTQGRLKPCAKTSRQRRRAPLRQRVRDALEALPPRLDSPLLFPAARAVTSTSRNGDTASGHRPSAPPASHTAGSTTFATPTRPGVSPPASTSSPSHGEWGRLSR
jgi:site-specific recombinase XerD